MSDIEAFKRFDYGELGHYEVWIDPTRSICPFKWRGVSYQTGAETTGSEWEFIEAKRAAEAYLEYAANQQALF